MVGQCEVELLELKWFCMPESRGTRLIQFWAYLEGLKFWLQKRLS